MEEGRLAYRVRTAEAGDATALRDAIGSTLAHPDHQGRRESYSGAAAAATSSSSSTTIAPAQTGRWLASSSATCASTTTCRFATSAPPATSRRLAWCATCSTRHSTRFGPSVAGQDSSRRDAWLEIFQAIPGFYLEGEEYRRPHYWTIWRWDRQHARKPRSRPATHDTATAAAAAATAVPARRPVPTTPCRRLARTDLARRSAARRPSRSAPDGAVRAQARPTRRRSWRTRPRLVPRPRRPTQASRQSRADAHPERTRHLRCRSPARHNEVAST